MAGTRTLTSEPPRSTAYYYADLERLKRKSPDENELSEYVATNEVVNDIPAREIPPFRDRNSQLSEIRRDLQLSELRDTQLSEIRRDLQLSELRDTQLSEIRRDLQQSELRDTQLSEIRRDLQLSEIRDPQLSEAPLFRDRDQQISEIPLFREIPPFRDRQWSLPEYNTPENSRKGETYSTAGTFPMPEPKEKEPLLAELEVVGKVPLSSLDSGVRRSRSWYLCCPDVGEEEVSEWRYSSLHPVTRPPMPRDDTLALIATQSSGRDELSALRSERDALARALAGERARAAGAARAHDARLAELHGVIAELVRRRATDKQAAAIPEEDGSDECESTTQPAGELENDTDRSRTEQNSSSLLSPCELPTPQEKVVPEDTTDTSAELHIRLEKPRLELPSAPADEVSLHLSEKESHACLNARCCEAGLDAGASSCEREHGSSEHRVYTASPGRCESRQAKLASRVKLKRTEDSDNNHMTSEEVWCTEAAERLALDVCAQADLREALVAANNDGEAMNATLNAWKVRCARLQADCAVLQAALARAADTQHRLYCACSVQESVCVCVCLALGAADRALEAYDVLLALAETDHSGGTPEREAAELIASQLLARLDAEPAVTLGSPLLSPGPWLQHANACSSVTWDRGKETRLRAHAARLKAETVSLRPDSNPQLFSYHDVDEEEIPKSAGASSMADMEAAVMMQEVLTAKEALATAHANSFHANKQTNSQTHTHDYKNTSEKEHKGESTRSRRRARERHWLETQASETDL